MPCAESHLTNRVVSFRVPYLTRRVAQSTWEFSASGCSSSAVACGLCKPLGRVSLDAHVDEQRREKAEARVPFLLVSFLWARKEKTLAEGRNKMPKQSAEPSAQNHPKNDRLKSHRKVQHLCSTVTKLCMYLAWMAVPRNFATLRFPACTEMTDCCKAY
jgi:hypothetical protein